MMIWTVLENSDDREMSAERIPSARPFEVVLGLKTVGIGRIRKNRRMCVGTNNLLMKTACEPTAKPAVDGCPWKPGDHTHEQQRYVTKMMLGT